MSSMATPSTEKKYHFYTGQEYYAALAKGIEQTKAGDRVLLATLWVLPREPLIAGVLQAAKAAARRGVEVILLTDAFTFLIKGGLHPGPSYFLGTKLRLMPKEFHRRFAALKELERAGGKYMIINQPRRPLVSPFQGRSHIKFSVVNDRVYLGGCNLGNSDFLDVMVGWEDKHIADWLDGFTRRILATGSVLKALDGQDQVVVVDNQTKLVIDAGKVNQSVILDKALAIIDEAKETLLITYQYFPHGVTIKHLAAATKSQVRLRAYYNHFSKHSAPLNLVYGILAWKTRRNGPAEFSTHRLSRQHPFYLHAKIVASEKAAVLSSHNYIDSGVKYGTAEIGLVSTDPDFVRAVTAAFDQQLS